MKTTCLEKSVTKKRDLYISNHKEETFFRIYEGANFSCLDAFERKCIKLTAFRAYSTVLSIICSVVSIGIVTKECYNVNENGMSLRTLSCKM